jgi:hypothetical protein
MQTGRPSSPTSARYRQGVAAVLEGQNTGSPGVLRLGRSGEKEEEVVGIKIRCSLAEGRGGSGQKSKGRRRRRLATVAGGLVWRRRSWCRAVGLGRARPRALPIYRRAGGRACPGHARPCRQLRRRPSGLIG